MTARTEIETAIHDAEPFQQRGVAFWRELVTEAGKLSFDRRPTRFAQHPCYQLLRASIAAIYSSVDLWHGTGRYKYGPGGKILDVLQTIGRQGGLMPQKDEWDVQSGPIRVVCTASSRMYARLYAGLYCPKGRRIGNELGTRELWAYYFFLSSAIVAIFERRLSFRAIISRDLNALFPNVADKTQRWVSKISSIPISQRRAFLQGTDIENNYPILMGLKGQNFCYARTSRFIGLHERRSLCPVALKDVTHMEVPLDRVTETMHLLRSLDVTIPIIPIEFCEEYSRGFSFWKLVNGHKLL